MPSSEEDLYDSESDDYGDYDSQDDDDDLSRKIFGKSPSTSIE